MKKIFDSAEYRRSRAAYMFQCAFGYFIMLFVADAFLAKLLTSIGIGDALTGIISSFISPAFVFQLGAIFLLKTKFNAKTIEIFFNCISRVFFLSEWTESR